MFEIEELRRMSPQDRYALQQALAELDGPGPAAAVAAASVVTSMAGRERRRVIVLAAIIVCCVVLAAWTGLLAVTLPRYYRAGGWRGAWVGFDIALLITFAATGWAAWRHRQVLIICLTVLATLLCCDAWFDVVLDARTSGFWLSLGTALLIELPLAFLAAAAARRLMRLTGALLGQFQGRPGQLALRHIPLLGYGPPGRLRDMFGRTQAENEAAQAEPHGQAGRP